MKIRYSITSVLMGLICLTLADLAWSKEAAPCDWDGNLGFWTPNIAMGVVRVPADNPHVEKGEGLTDWIEVNQDVVCTSEAEIEILSEYSDGYFVEVEVDGKKYASVDGAEDGLNPLGVGAITEFEILGKTVALSKLDGTVVGKVHLPQGRTSVKARARLVGLGLTVPEGQAMLRLGAIPAAILRIEGAGGAAMIYAAQAAAEVVYQKASCTPSGLTQTISLGSFATASAPSVGGMWSNSSEVAFTLSCPQTTKGITARAVFTDVSNPTGGSDSLELTGLGSATGVALKLLKPDGQPVTFGPESIDPSVTHSVELFKTAPNQQEVKSVKFDAVLYRTAADITPGRISASALVTLSYE